LAIRCLCSEIEAGLEANPEGYIVPVHSVGVQGDSRSYAPVLCIETLDQTRATDLINRISGVNRVIARVRTTAPLADLRVRVSALSPGRLARLRHADAIVRRLSYKSGFDRRIWQFPVVLIPLGTAAAPDSVVLRPIDSVDGMTAQSVVMPDELLDSISTELLAVPGVGGVFYDLSHKPPATIEWE
jgi:GMP synthase (glutamine-hydrolysing)